MKTRLDYYKVFYETARHESFSSAARELYISQSAISQCIGQLEKDLSTTLFVRSKRGVSLTTEGTLLFHKVKSAMDSLEQGETLLARLHHLESGSLFIGAGDAITKHFLLPYLEKFHKMYPEIRIEMANSYSSRMLQFVKEGKAELAFVNLPVTDSELEITPCFEIHDIFVCGPQYKEKKSYSWNDLAKEPLILLEASSSSRRNLDKIFQSKHITLTPQIEIAVHDLLLEFASIHLGISCVVREFSKNALENSTVHEINLNPPLPARSIGYAHLKHNTLSLPAQTFLKLIEEDNATRLFQEDGLSHD